MLLVKGVCRAERMRKDGKSLENLKIENTRQEGRGGAMNAPTEATLTARQGCP